MRSQVFKMTETVQLQEICNMKKGKKVNSSKNKSAKSIPYLLIDTLRGKEPEFFTEDKNYIQVLPDDVLVVGDGANSGLVGTGLTGAAGSTIIRIRADIKQTHKDYLSHFLKSKFELLNTSVKGAAIPHLKTEEMMKLQIRLPNVSEQALIVEEIEKQLTRLDNAIKSFKLIDEKLKIYRESVLKIAFTKGFEEGIKFNLLKLEDFKSQKKHSIKRGPFGSAIKKSFFVPKGENTYKVYEQKNAIYNNATLGEYYIDKNKFEELKVFTVKPGDMIISCSGTIGCISIIPDNAELGVINQALLKLTLDSKKINAQYFIHLFQSKYLQIDILKNTRGSAIKNIASVKDLKQINFPVPRIEDQEVIVHEIEARFSIIDKLKETIDASRIKAEQLRNSILKSAFEGKLIKGDNHD